MNAETNLKCVSLKGEIADWGKHILMPFGVTLCGIPTVDTDVEMFPQLKDKNFEGMRFSYKIEPWNITCARCMEMISIVKTHSEKI